MSSDSLPNVGKSASARVPQKKREKKGIGCFTSKTEDRPPKKCAGAYRHGEKALSLAAGRRPVLSQGGEGVMVIEERAGRKEIILPFRTYCRREEAVFFVAGKKGG